MVSPGKLRAVCKLRDAERDAFEPSIDETGRVSYPFAAEHLDERDGEAADCLQELGDVGVLDPEFEHKVYVCPNCAAEGLQYSTGCPHCGSVHATQEPLVTHAACGTTLDAGRGRTPNGADDQGNDGRTYCPECEEDVDADTLESDRRYRCHDCDSWFDSPADRLWCRECPRVYVPEDAQEEPLYRYPLSAAGEEWLTEQLEARRSLAETFETRGYETSVDVALPAGDGEVPVHVYAEDDLLDDRIVAGVHDSPTLSAAERLLEASREANARALVLVTSGSVDERVAGRLEAEDVTIVSSTDDGFTREYVVSERDGESTPLLDRLGSLFSSRTGR